MTKTYTSPDSSYTSLIDEDIILYIHEGDSAATEYIFNKYERIVHQKANGYFLMGSERDDVVQEGRIGLYKAIADYDATKKSSFKSFAELCITRQIITSVKSATRLKHTPLNSYVSIYRPVYEDEEPRALIDTIQNENITDPLDEVIHKEEIKHLRSTIMKALTMLERQVLKLYVKGYSYAEISDQLDRDEKSIDNALQRIRRKVDRLMKG